MQKNTVHASVMNEGICLIPFFLCSFSSGFIETLLLLVVWPDCVWFVMKIFISEGQQTYMKAQFASISEKRWKAQTTQFIRSSHRALSPEIKSSPWIALSLCSPCIFFPGSLDPCKASPANPSPEITKRARTGRSEWKPGPRHYILSFHTARITH